VGCGFLAAQFFPNLGDVGILIANTKISLPITVLISLVIVSFVLFLIVLRSIANIYLFFKKIINVLVGKDQHLALSIYHKAMHEKLAGNYLEAQRLFIKSAKGSEQPLLNYLQAAECAQLLKNYTVRDKFMNACYHKFVDSLSLINFQYALMCELAGDYEKSLSLLLSVDPLNINEHEFLKLKANLLFKTANFNKLMEILPSVAKADIFTSEQLVKMQLATYNHALHETSNQAELEQLWHEIPKNLRNMPGLLITYAKLLAHFDVTQAEVILRKAINANYDPLLVEAYGKIETPNLGKQIANAEHWYKEHHEDYALNLCLGRLCANHKLWGKAKDYLEKSLALKPEQEAFMQYAKMCALMGDQTSKVEIIDRSLKLVK
jgi:HemY protein